MRLAFAYDRVAPECLGGAERYYATLCRRLAREHHVRYLTEHHWGGARAIVRDGVELLGVCEPGGGRLLPKLRFALALARHLLRRGGEYDVVHVCCFPHVAVLAAWLALLPHRSVRLVVDWHEVLPWGTWRARLGVLGILGWLVQAAALRVGDASVTFSHLHERRLRALGRRAPVRLVPEFHPDLDRALELAPGARREPLVVFAGRLVEEKRPELVPAVVAALRRRDLAWRGVIFGAGDGEAAVRTAIDREGVADSVTLAGFAPWDELASAFARARALVFPSAREGFGLVVLEAAQQGLPTVLVRGSDNAAIELVEAGRNGQVVGTPDPEAMAEAVLALVADPAIHDTTRAWFAEASRRFDVAETAAALARLHAELV